ncbi:GPI-linked NAD(P)(+)--arginine ADP-ribosyltransferase 1 [Anabarilius grahami]|uniref:NAD(P)(+)--arginine ADP-ribosyltransferase n=1 Tax=Anabarilius grahami TaxID=495550 RepID=A0A3N0YYT1_ANAGA|nr:GPI-linked NAD(P)(+)--arginine ADP-ribosyltransferase 1 [Anabarilius grahami]
MLLIIEALLLILAALGQDHRAASVQGQIIPLDMAPDSVDDQYMGCREKMAKLKKTQNQCYSTFRGTKVRFNEDVLNKEVRFGSFSSSSLDRKVARRFGTKSCFEIYTCEGADVTKYSKLPHEKEVLIPPYKKFKVVDVKKKEEQKGLWCDTVFTLKSSGIRSDLNCALFKKPTKTKTKYYVLNNVL